MGKAVMKWCIVAVIVIVVILLGLWVSSDRPSSTDSKEKIEDIFLKLFSDNRVNLEKGSWYFGVILNELESNYSFVKYIDYLSVNQFQDQELKIFIFSISHRTPIREFREINNISVSILPITAEITSLRSIFQGSNQQRAVCLIDPSGNVVFKANFVQENDVRLILEKNLTGKIFYDRKNEPGIKTGDFFKPIKLLNIRTNDETILNENLCPRLWIFFTSNCVSCALKSSLMTYRSLENILLQKLKIPVGLVFSPYFSIEEIESRINRLKVKNDVFIAQDELKGIENIYLKSPDSENNVVTIITNSENKVVYLEAFPIFLNHLKGDYFEKNRKLYVRD